MDFGSIDQQAAQMDDFADCVLTGRDTPVPGELGRRDMQVISAIYESVRTGKTVAVRTSNSAQLRGDNPEVFPSLPERFVSL
jgi:hypothetical protein